MWGELSAWSEPALHKRLGGCSASVLSSTLMNYFGLFLQGMAKRRKFVANKTGFVWSIHLEKWPSLSDAPDFVLQRILWS